LSAVIDFGSSGVGDPASDLSISWTLLQGESRDAFRAALPLDRANSDLIVWELAAQCLRTAIEMNRKTKELLTGRLSSPSDLGCGSRPVVTNSPALSLGVGTRRQSGFSAGALPFGQGWWVPSGS
jgi:hypothetical protein